MHWPQLESLIEGFAARKLWDCGGSGPASAINLCDIRMNSILMLSEVGISYSKCGSYCNISLLAKGLAPDSSAVCASSALTLKTLVPWRLYWQCSHSLLAQELQASISLRTCCLHSSVCYCHCLCSIFASGNALKMRRNMRQKEKEQINPLARAVKQLNSCCNSVDFSGVASEMYLAPCFLAVTNGNSRSI